MKHPVRPNAMAREESIFNAAVQLDPAKRSACLDQACEGDTALRARIEKLLAVANDTLFDVPPAHQKGIIRKKEPVRPSTRLTMELARAGARHGVLALAGSVPAISETPETSSALPAKAGTPNRQSSPHATPILPVQRCNGMRISKLANSRK